MDELSDRSSHSPMARLQTVLAIVFAALTVLALVIPVWIEEVTGFSPDGGNGELELLLAAPFGITSIVLGILAWRSQRRVMITH